MSYSTLLDNQIKQLKKQGCSAENWSEVYFKNISSNALARIKNVDFWGTVKIGKLDLNNNKSSSSKNSGIYNSTIQNCILGDHVYISKVNRIINYIVGNEVKLDNINIISVEKESSFGNGISINVINESGKREIPIYNKLSSHLAYILAIYRYRTKAICEIKKMIKFYAERIKFNYGKIENNVTICNCNQILDVNIGANATINGALKLKNGSINSTSISPVFIGVGVIAENFIIGSDSRVDNSTLIKNCFVGQGCILDKNYSAVDSAFFANCQGFHGEACSLFAGPFTVTHHKSTLLIAGIFSFMNAGSGSNQSNHMYKLGPIHQGVVERGAKTTSDSYLLWPAKIGAFNLVMGRHYSHPDTSNFPFSYLIEGNDRISNLVPGTNLRSIGTIRDAKKFPLRDIRNDKKKLDYINYNLLSPYTIHRMINGRKILKNLFNASGELAESFSYNGMMISKKALLNGIQLYEKAIHKFLGNSLISRLKDLNNNFDKEIQNRLIPTLKSGSGKWIDISGLICPLKLLLELLDNIENGKISSLDKIDKTFKEWYDNYYEYEWTWAAGIIEDFYQIKLCDITKKDIVKIVKIWQKSVIELDKLLYEDAKKEFSLASSIGFGADGDERIKALDFQEVRGDFKSNESVKEIKQHIVKKQKLGEMVIAQMSEVSKYQN